MDDKHISRCILITFFALIIMLIWYDVNTKVVGEYTVLKSVEESDKKEVKYPLSMTEGYEGIIKDNSKLLNSCPFCGADSKRIVLDKDAFGYYVWCRDCLACSPSKKPGNEYIRGLSKEDAIDAWNKRKILKEEEE